MEISAGLRLHPRLTHFRWPLVHLPGHPGLGWLSPPLEKEEARGDVYAQNWAEVTFSFLAQKGPYVQYVFGVYREGGECFLPSVAAAPAITFLRTKIVSRKNKLKGLFSFYFLEEEGWWVCLKWLFPKALMSLGTKKCSSTSQWSSAKTSFTSVCIQRRTLIWGRDLGIITVIRRFSSSLFL